MTVSESQILVQEVAPQKFALTVTFAGQAFECGSYISRGDAGGRVFVERKKGEEAGRGSGRYASDFLPYD
jgi:hypothetical protein